MRKGSIRGKSGATGPIDYHAVIEPCNLAPAYQ